jgi:hypothetical protein
LGGSIKFKPKKGQQKHRGGGGGGCATAPRAVLCRVDGGSLAFSDLEIFGRSNTRSDRIE